MKIILQIQLQKLHYLWILLMFTIFVILQPLSHKIDSVKNREASDQMELIATSDISLLWLTTNKLQSFDTGSVINYNYKL